MYCKDCKHFWEECICDGLAQKQGLSAVERFVSYEAGTQGAKSITKTGCCENCAMQEDWLDDGFGNKWSPWCGHCGKKTMQIVRPGKIQCCECS